MLLNCENTYFVCFASRNYLLDFVGNFDLGCDCVAKGSHVVSCNDELLVCSLNGFIGDLQSSRLVSGSLNIVIIDLQRSRLVNPVDQPTGRLDNNNLFNLIKTNNLNKLIKF